MRHNQQGQSQNLADGMPPFFAVNNPVKEIRNQWVVKDSTGNFKAYAVLGVICPVFVLIPCKLHGSMYAQKCASSRECKGRKFPKNISSFFWFIRLKRIFDKRSGQICTSYVRAMKGMGGYLNEYCIL
jgi:hypothetical protein